MYERLCRYLPPVLLIAIALLQIRYAYFGDLLCPSKGGGYGLFSTVDKLPNRQIRIFAVMPDGAEHPLGFPSGHWIAKAAKKATAFPTEHRLNRVARFYAGHESVSTAREIRVEVWRMAFDTDSLSVERIPVATTTVPTGASG